MQAWWLVAVWMIVLPFLQDQAADESVRDSQAEQAALNQLLAQASPTDDGSLSGEGQAAATQDPQDDDAKESEFADDEGEEEDSPEALRIVAQNDPVAEAEDAEATEMNLTGSDVGISMIGSDSLVITANETDLAILTALIRQLDSEMPNRELRIVMLDNQPASDVASTLQESISKLYPFEADRPEQSVSITAIASNMLLLVAPETRIEQIVAIAEAIDVKQAGIPDEVMIFQVKNRNASEAAVQLEELITALRQQQGADAAKEFQITPNDANGTIMIVGPVSQRDTIQMLLEQIDAEAQPGFGELKLVAFPLLNADPDDLVQIFEDMLKATDRAEGVTEQIRRLVMLRRIPGEPVVELPPLNLEKTLRLIPDKGTNSVLVATVEENIDPIGEIIAVLDDLPLSVEMGIRIFPLHFADAETVAESLEKMFEQGKDLPKAAPGTESTKAVPVSPEGEALVYNVDIVPDLRTNTVFVFGRQLQLSLAERIVAEMDKPATAIKYPLQLLALGENIDATRIGEIVTELWDRRVEALEALNIGKAAVEREKVFLAVDIRSNSLILSASNENLTEIQEITSKLNTARDRLIDQIRIFNCHNTSAADLASKIEELWERKRSLKQEGEIFEDMPVLVADQRSNSLVIASSAEDFEEITALIEKLESQPLAPIAQIRMVQLANNDASEISSMFEQLFEERMQQRLVSGQEENPSDRVALAFDAPTNTMLIASSKDNYDEMMQLIEVLDAEPDTEGVVKSYVLENAEAGKVAETIQELFDQGLYNPSTGLDSQLTEERMQIAIVSDARANAIIVSASKPNMSIVGRLVEQMDSENVPLGDNIKLFSLEFADAVKLTDMLDRLFEGIKSTAPDPDIFTEPTIIPDDRSNVLIVSGTRDALRRTEDLIAKLDRQAGAPTSSFEIYTLQFSSAVKMVAVMQDMFDKRAEGNDDERTPINLFADEGSNAMICSAARDDQIMVQTLLELLDKPSNIARQFAIFPLKRAKAEGLSDRLEQLFAAQTEGAGSDARVDAIGVQPDPRTNSLIVWASPTEMDNIGTIINRLDTTDPAVEMGIRVIQLKQALAEDLAEVLEETLVGDAGGAGQDSEAVIVSYMVLNEDGTRDERRLLRQDLTITPDARTNTLTVMAPAESMDMLETLVLDFDRIKPAVAVIELFPLVNADAEEVVVRLQELFEEQGGDEAEQTLTLADGGLATGGGDVRQQLRFTADRRTNTVIAAGSEVDLNMVKKLIYQLDSQDSEERVYLVYEAKNSTSDALSTAISGFAQAEQDRLSQLDDTTSLIRQAERSVTVIGDEQSNSIVLGVSPRYYDQYMTLVQELDRPPPQVMIQVLIAEVTLDNRVSLGIELAGQDLLFTENAVQGPNGTVNGADFDIVAGTDLGAATGTLGGFNFTITGEDFTFLLRALETDSKLEVLSRPTLLVNNNEEGNITIGDRVPIVQGSTFTDAGNTSTQIQYEDTGIILDVVPHINPDGFVSLEINPEISQVSDSSVQLTEGLSAPIISERSAETTITVKDGETIVIGGLITDQTSESESKIPFLGDLPGMGVLFRNTSTQSRKTELLIILTVDILRGVEDVRHMSVEQRDKSGLLDNVIHHPLMEGLRIHAEEDGLTPQEHQPRTSEPIERDRELYGPTPDVYGPKLPQPARVSNDDRPVVPVRGAFGPPIPGRRSTSLPQDSAGFSSTAVTRAQRRANARTVRLASAPPRLP